MSAPLHTHRLHQLIRLGAGSTATAQFSDSVFRGIAAAPTFCNIANNDFRRNLEAEEVAE